jgi:hypothetical protein
MNIQYEKIMKQISYQNRVTSSYGSKNLICFVSKVNLILFITKKLASYFCFVDKSIKLYSPYLTTAIASISI